MSKRNLKKYIILALILILIITIIIVIILNNSSKKENEVEVIDGFTTTSENGEKINVSDKIKEEKNVEGLIFSNIKISMKNNETLVTGTVSNPTNEIAKGFYFELNALDELGETIATTNGLLDSEIQANGSTTFSIITSKDFSNCYDIKLVKIKDVD